MFMRHGYTREEQDQAAKEIIAAYREAAALFPAIRRVAEAFNGKVYNKKFSDALTAATGKRICVQAHGEAFSFYYYGPAYGYQYTLATIKKSDMSDGKRINACALMESAREKREDFLQRAQKIESAAAQIDDIKKQLEYFRNMVRRVSEQLPYEAREIWGIDTRVY